MAEGGRYSLTDSDGSLLSIEGSMTTTNQMQPLEYSTSTQGSTNSDPSTGGSGTFHIEDQTRNLEMIPASPVTVIPVRSYQREPSIFSTSSTGTVVDRTNNDRSRSTNTMSGSSGVTVMRQSSGNRSH